MYWFCAGGYIRIFHSSISFINSSLKAFKLLQVFRNGLLKVLRAWRRRRDVQIFHLYVVGDALERPRVSKIARVGGGGNEALRYPWSFKIAGCPGAARISKVREFAQGVRLTTSLHLWLNIIQTTGEQMIRSNSATATPVWGSQSVNMIKDGPRGVRGGVQGFQNFPEGDGDEKLRYWAQGFRGLKLRNFGKTHYTQACQSSPAEAEVLRVLKGLMGLNLSRLPGIPKTFWNRMAFWKRHFETFFRRSPSKLSKPPGFHWGFTSFQSTSSFQNINNWAHQAITIAARCFFRTKAFAIHFCKESKICPISVASASREIRNAKALSNRSGFWLESR